MHAVDMWFRDQSPFVTSQFWGRNKHPITRVHTNMLWYISLQYRMTWYLRISNVQCKVRKHNDDKWRIWLRFWFVWASCANVFNQPQVYWYIAKLCYNVSVACSSSSNVIPNRIQTMKDRIHEQHYNNHKHWWSCWWSNIPVFPVHDRIPSIRFVQKQLNPWPFPHKGFYCMLRAKFLWCLRSGGPIDMYPPLRPGHFDRQHAYKWSNWPIPLRRARFRSYRKWHKFYLIHIHKT